jgi:hypothetical protein
MKPLIKTITREKGVEKSFFKIKGRNLGIKVFSNKFLLIYTFQKETNG